MFINNSAEVKMSTLTVKQISHVASVLSECGRSARFNENEAAAVFPEQRSLGHFDCGGIPLSA